MHVYISPVHVPFSWGGSVNLYVYKVTRTLISVPIKVTTVTVSTVTIYRLYNIPPS